MWSTLLSLVSLVSLVTVRALPTPSIEARQAITTLTPAQISAFKPFTFYASAGYCDPSTTLSWSCGANCNANPTFKPIASGGDGVETQFCECISLLVAKLWSDITQGLSASTRR